MYKKGREKKEGGGHEDALKSSSLPMKLVRRERRPGRHEQHGRDGRLRRAAPLVGQPIHERHDRRAVRDRRHHVRAIGSRQDVQK